MAVTLPTVDDFTETTVLTMIRKVVDYLCSDYGLVAQINNNDITGFTSSYTNNLLKIDATKGDGTTIPVCSLTIKGGSSTGNPYPTGITGTVGEDGNITFTVTMSSGSPLTTTINMNYFASAEDLSDLQEQVSGIKPIVTVNDSVSPPTISVTVNGTTSTANLPVSGGSGNVEIIEVDPSSISNDTFKDGDILLFNMHVGYSVSPSLTSWTSEISNVAVSNTLNSQNFTAVFEMSSKPKYFSSKNRNTDTNCNIEFAVFIQPLLYWQSISPSQILMNITIKAYNGVSCVANSNIVEYNNLSSFVDSIKIIRSN